MNFSSEEFNRSLENKTDSSNADGAKILLDVVIWCSISFIIATLIFNALIITIYIQVPSMRTSFNVYIVNLAITEIILALTAMPGSFVRVLYGYWPYNAISCSLFLYVGQGLGAAVRYCHILITANRFWAVTFPVNYKIHHSARIAKILVVLMWIFIHVLNLPVIIRGRLRKGVTPMDLQCFLGTEGQFGDVLAVESFSFTIPECVIVLVYLFIAIKLRNRRRARILVSRVFPMNLPLPGVVLEQTPTRRANRNRIRFKSHNRVLAYLVVAVVLCWTPNHIYYLLVDATGYWNQTFFTVQYFAQYANSWLNPLLIYLADSQIRAEINGLFCHRS